MSGQRPARLTGPVVEEELQLTLAELCRACRAPEHALRVWVVEGVLSPAEPAAADWRFTGDALRRARLAARLQRDLDVNAAGIALALDLLDRIAALEARLQRAGAEDPPEPSTTTRENSP